MENVYLQKYKLYMVSDNRKYYTVNNPRTVKKFIIEEIGKESQENFIVLYLDIKNAVSGYSIISIGTLSESIVHPREVFKIAIYNNSNGIIVAHNHPSGEIEPSKEDINTTNRLVDCGKLLGIPLLDHVIVNTCDYYSLQEHGYIK